MLHKTLRIFTSTNGGCWGNGLTLIKHLNGAFLLPKDVDRKGIFTTAKLKFSDMGKGG